MKLLKNTFFPEREKQRQWGKTRLTWKRGHFWHPFLFSTGSLPYLFCLRVDFVSSLQIMEGTLKLLFFGLYLALIGKKQAESFHSSLRIFMLLCFCVRLFWWISFLLTGTFFINVEVSQRAGNKICTTAYHVIFSRLLLPLFMHVKLIQILLILCSIFYFHYIWQTAS